MKHFSLVITLTWLAFTAHGQWTDLSSSRNDIVFIDELTGWMAADRGALLKTIDGGKTWFNQHSPSEHEDYEITKIFVFNGGTSLRALTHDKVSMHGGIIISDDAGKTWKRVLSKSDQTFAHFGNASIGWYWRGRLSGDPWLYQTTDGGNTWTATTISGVVGVTSHGNDVWVMQRVDDKSYMSKSSNMGTSWTSMEITPTYYLDQPEVCTHFVDANNGWMATGLSKEFSTTDGGTTWTQLTHSAFDGNTKQFYFVNHDVGYALVGSPGVIIKTVDAGATWNRVYANENYREINKIYFKSEDIGVAIGKYGQYIETKNGGATWEVTNLCEIDGWHVTDLAFNGRDIWAIGQDFLKTSKDGVTWKHYEPVEDNDHYDVTLVAFGKDGRGIMARENAFAKTGNNGETWENYNPSFQFTGSLYNNKLWYDNSDNVWVLRVDDQATLYKSEDHGQTFNVTWRSTSMLSSVRDVTFQSDTKVWLYGDTRTYKSTDAGKTWKEIKEGITTLFFVSEDIGWKLIDQKKIYKTIDGGDTWTFLTTINHWSGFKFLSFVDEKVGWIGSAYGIIFKTTDGGMTWTNDVTGVLSNYKDLIFTKNDEGEVIGYLGGTSLLRLKTHYVPEPVTEFGELTASVNDLGYDFAEIKWTDNSDFEDGFIVQRRTDIEGFSDLDTLPASTTIYRDNSVISGYTYYYRVVAFRTQHAIRNSNDVSVNVPFNDEMAPELLATAPYAGETDVEPTAPLAMSFSEPVEFLGGTFSAFDAATDQLIATYDVPASLPPHDYVITIFLNDALPAGKAMYLQVPSDVVRDLAGNAFGGITDNQWHFTTRGGPVMSVEADQIPLQIESNGQVVSISTAGIEITHVIDVLGRSVPIETTAQGVSLRKIDGVMIISGAYQGRKFSKKLVIR